MDLDQLNHNVGLVMFNLWPGLLAFSQPQSRYAHDN